MRFVDTNVFIYAVGRPHPLREEARNALRSARDEGVPLITSAEVLQELLHAYLPVGRTATLEAALRLARTQAEVVPLGEGDVLLAWDLATRHPGLGARDLAHLAVSLRLGVRDLVTFDRGLAAAFAAAG